MNEEQTSTGIQSQSSQVNKMQSAGDKKLKEKLSSNQLRSMFQQWINAIDQNKDLEIEIKGESCRIPINALEENRTKVEYESEGGEFEFELELKWKASKEESQMRQ